MADFGNRCRYIMDNGKRCSFGIGISGDLVARLCGKHKIKEGRKFNKWRYPAFKGRIKKEDRFCRRCGRKLSRWNQQSCCFSCPGVRIKLDVIFKASR